jgi:hypothetical protein
MLHYTIVQALGRARLDDLHRQAQRDALARAARQAHVPDGNRPHIVRLSS